MHILGCAFFVNIIKVLVKADYLSLEIKWKKTNV